MFFPHHAGQQCHTIATSFSVHIVDFRSFRPLLFTTRINNPSYILPLTSMALVALACGCFLVLSMPLFVVVLMCDDFLDVGEFCVGQI